MNGLWRRPWWAWACAISALALLVWPGPGSLWTDPEKVTWALVIVSLVVAGWLLAGHPEQHRNGALMLALAAAQSATTSLGEIDPGPWQLLVYLARPANLILLGVLLLRWPHPRLQTRAEIWAVRYACWSVAVLGVVGVVTWYPPWIGYHGAAWWITLVHDRTLGTWTIWSNYGNEYGLLPLLFLVLIGLRIGRAPRPERRQLAPVVVSALALVGIAVTRMVTAIAGVALTGTESVLENIALIAVPLSVVVSLAVRRVQRALAVEALLQPSRLPDPESVRVALARIVGDPHLTLALWSPDINGYVSPDGLPVTGEAPGRFIVDVARAEGTPLARVGVDHRWSDSADLVESVARAASVALDNARLQAELRVRQRAMEESSDRLHRAEDAERSLSRMVPGGLADRLRRDAEALSRTERLTVTVLMSDVRGYTGIAEWTPPADLAAQLNEHRRAMNAVIIGEGGTVMQYVGDAVLAVFGAPDPQAGHQDRALAAAVGMHAAQGELDGAWAKRDLRPFGLGIGICTGEVAAAFLGSDERVEYTIVGDTVNVAARLTEAARPAGTTIASAATVAGATAGWSVDAMPPLQVKGRVTSVSAYRLIGPLRPATPTPNPGRVVPVGLRPAGAPPDRSPVPTPRSER